MRAFRRLGPILLMLLALPMAALAQPAGGRQFDLAELLDTWDSEAALVEERLARGRLDPPTLDALRAEVEAQQTRLPAVMERAEAAVEPLRQQLEALGPPPEEGETEDESVAAERRRLQNRLAEAEALVKRIARADARAEALTSEIIAQRRALFTERLLTRGPSALDPANLIEGVAAMERTLREIGAETRTRIEAQTLDLDVMAGKLAPLLLLVLALFAVQALRRMTVVRLTRMIGPDSPQGRRIAIGVALTATRLVLPAASLGIVLLAIYRIDLLGPQGLALLQGIAEAVLIFVGAYALSLAFFAPGAARLRLSQLEDDAAAGAHRWIVALAAVAALDRALVERGQEVGMPFEAVGLLNAALLMLGGLALWRTVSHLADGQTAAPPPVVEQIAEESEEEEPEEGGEDRVLQPALLALLRFFGRLSAIAAPVLALAGYFAASRYLFYPLVFSGAAICLCLLLFHIVQSGVEHLVSHWTAAGQVSEKRKGQIRLIPVLVGFLLSVAAIPVLALIWGASASDLALVWRQVREGFQIGEVRLAPGDFFAFLLVFSIGFLLTRMIQAVLGRSVLPLTSLDAGGRDAIRAGVGYLGIILAAVAAISMAGVDLSSLAIALGALSVGIGFGLQNVVNNFVSGIILLIERPIKTGDWVELTSGMGYVKRINVRSTEIETFDRSALIVPNSELISAPVVNWTHSNNNGRIILPVRVAYGTDPRKVEKILLEIGRGHPMLLRRPAPYVLFQSFGSDALQFEIRGVLRDVNWVLNATSDLNFEIAHRFAEEGIEIPFAQRDLHLRNADEVARALGTHMRPGGEATARPVEPVPEEAAVGEPAGEESAGEENGTELLRLADPSGRGLAPGPSEREAPEAPWETLAEAEETIEEKTAGGRSDPLSGRRAIPAAPGSGAGEGEPGDGR